VPGAHWLVTMTASAGPGDGGNLGRFSGFADLYDSVRPAPPQSLGPLLCSYSRTQRPVVVDLGSGSGLSSRWAATWASRVVGIEPNDDMRTIAESRPVPGVSYRRATADRTGLEDGAADVVLIVQALHWMEPGPTLTEVARILRPGGVVAAADADWPPVAGSARAEAAWVALDRRMRVFEDRVVAGDVGETLRRPVEEGALGAGTMDLGDGEGVRLRGDGVRSWSKGGHLGRMAASGLFAATREIVLHEVAGGGADRFVALMRSQGSYQQLRRLGLSDDDLGMGELERAVRAGYAEIPVPGPLSLSWRVRLGVTPG
jgi:SAM-dependent methyltransferase